MFAVKRTLTISCAMTEASQTKIEASAMAHLELLGVPTA